MLHRILSLVAVSLLLPVAALTQFELGTVVGTVKDQSDLPMADATVEIRSLATNIARQTTTSATGDFDFVALQPGQYVLKVKHGGFKEKTQNFELTVGQRAELNVSMKTFRP